MICNNCYAIANLNPRKGDLVSLEIFNDEVLCYRCARQKEAELAVA